MPFPSKIVYNFTSEILTPQYNEKIIFLFVFAIGNGRDCRP